MRYLISLMFFTSVIAQTCYAQQQIFLPACNQIYLTNPLFQGSDADCKKHWDKAIKDKDLYMQSLLTLNGLAGQKADAKKALLLIQEAQISNYAPAEITGLKEEIQKRLANSQLMKKPVAYCALITSGYSGGICAAMMNDEKTRLLEIVINSLARQLSPNKSEALVKTYQAFKKYNSTDNDTQWDLGMFGGTASVQQSLDSMTEKTTRFSELLFNIIANPDKYKTVMNAKLLLAEDKKLNNIYQKLLNLKQVKSSTNSQAIIQAQRDWLEYRNALTQFSKNYCSTGDVVVNKETLNNIEQNLNYLVSEERVKAIGMQISTLDI